MKFWPFIQTHIDTDLSHDNVMEIFRNHTDSRQPGFYWGRTYTTTLWGQVKDDYFVVRPVVPYWNISPVHIRGKVKDMNGKRRITLTFVNPHLRVIVPLVIISFTLLLFRFMETHDYETVVDIGLWILFGAYIWVQVTFQIQARKTLDNIKSWFGK